ncbi:D-glycero-beta-D-manno-heptose-7-phosphate kinase [Polynucleobacter sp. 30F-ANTBAC]|jgi:D-glycero-beta-D-manno-heptose-7-phosphate kinase|uniref:D-glycero-beta-D-manno-heptose-7-phosphate kinase n=1 Tax=Polynucleobacter sp. 30F-ANTBAC TaxID=2689095 RepID=UPI001C0C230A|nr:D-glycero-beta-D-manno-heptose-7-phosphate kinase [Polynucleobacter sp. 30F-ANTBAC]MBU3599447.1 D-glycero-beta-D-manno-heptose-7-phosphate kinase [Polynucleobacter sp. 30F-ANTBAC]
MDIQLSAADIQQFRQARLLVVGDVMLDRYWFGDTERISPEAPVPVVHVSKMDERLGGAANVARNAASIGAQIAILGVVGDDEPGQRIEDLLKAQGVKSYLQKDPSLPTTVKLRVVARQQQLIRLDFEETPTHEALLNKLEQFQSLLLDVDAVIFSDYGKGGLTHVTQMIRAAREAGKVVLVDPKGGDYSKYQGASIITPNRSELRQVIGRWKDEADLTAKAQQLRQDLKLDALLLTRSEEGMSLFTADGVEHVKADAREVFDVSGAGDTVIATMAVALAAQWSAGQAMKLANKAGGIVVGKLGTATVSLEELQ